MSPSAAAVAISSTPDGREFLTRNGNFKPDVNGILRDPRGNALMGQGGTITIPVDVANVTIDGQGIITITDGKWCLG